MTNLRTPALPSMTPRQLSMPFESGTASISPRGASVRAWLTHEIKLQSDPAGSCMDWTHARKSPKIIIFPL